jgi:hypothetical protein
MKKMSRMNATCCKMICHFSDICGGDKTCSLHKQSKGLRKRGKVKEVGLFLVLAATALLLSGCYLIDGLKGPCA